MIYTVFAKVQDDTWDKVKPSFRTVEGAIRKAKKLCDGPLGTSSMYEIRDDEGGVTHTNGELRKMFRRMDMTGRNNLARKRARKTLPRKRQTYDLQSMGPQTQSFSQSQVTKLLRSMYHLAFGDAINPNNRVNKQPVYRVEDALRYIGKYS